MMNKQKKSKQKMATTKPRGSTVAPKLDSKRPAGSKGPKLLPQKHPLHRFFTKWTSSGIEVKTRLQYHDKKFLTETKGYALQDERVKKVREPDQQQAMSEGASSFMSPSMVYTFMLKGYSTISSNGSGVVNSYLQFDPSSSGYNFAEWADLAALFSEVRLDRVQLQVLTSNWSQASAPIEFVSFAAAIDPSAQGAPGSLGAVISLADGKFVNGQMSSSHGCIYNYSSSGNSWSPTSTVVVTPYAGCPGSFKIYGTGFPNTTQVAVIMVRFVYSFRCRS